MRNEQFWKEHIEVYNYIRDNYQSFRDIDLTTAISERFKIDIASENIRYLRRCEGWKKRVSTDVESGEKFEKVVFVGDFHAPYHDPVLFALFLVFLKYFKPDRLWILGDISDWYQVSSWDKNPKRLGHLQEDLDLANKLLDAMCQMVNKIEFVGGNHEYRMLRYLMKHPGLFGLKVLEVQSLLKLSERGIKYHPWKQPPTKYHGIQIHHGSLVRKHSGWTAKAHFEKYGGCGIIGHCHRGGSYLKRDMQGVWGWWENMCMCDLETHYVGFVDWIQGWSIAYFYKKDLFHLEQVPVIKHKFLFQGKLFSAKD